MEECVACAGGVEPRVQLFGCQVVEFAELEEPEITGEEIGEEGVVWRRGAKRRVWFGWCDR